MKTDTKDADIIDLGKLFSIIWKKRNFFFLKLWPITFVLACFYILSIPRFYTTTAKLAPEMNTSPDLGGLGSIASSFGFDLGSMQSSDAINPLLYPDLMEDNAFVARMFGVQVKSVDGTIATDYYTYLCKHQKTAWWNKGLGWVKSLLSSKKKAEEATGTFDPYYITREVDNVVNVIRQNITLAFDKKTGVISVTTQDQDPLICKTLADTIQVYLQEYITDYRTKKSRIDVNHYEELCQMALDEYNEARMAYASYADANRNAILQSVATRIENLESAMQLKYNNYTAYNAQLQAAYTKLQERTPAFTTLKGASVPIRPAGPKRMIFVAAMMILSTFVAIVVISRKYLLTFLLKH